MPDHDKTAPRPTWMGAAQGTGQHSNLKSTANPLPLYAIIDRRRDGRPRIVAEFADPQAAHDAAVLMRWAGDAVEVVLVTAIRGDEAAR